MQSRGTILCYYSSILFIIFFIKKIDLKKKLFFFSLLVILPIASNYFYLNVHQEIVENEKILNQNKTSSNKTSSNKTSPDKTSPRIIENETDFVDFFYGLTFLKVMILKRFLDMGPKRTDFC